MTNFSIDWPHGHTTRDGRPARIICTDAKGNYPIVALIDNGKHETSVSYTIKGGILIHDSPHNVDLINKKPMLRAWVNVYRDPNTKELYFGSSYYAEKRIPTSSTRHIACIPIEYDP